jgi:hypothetical protein
MTDDRDIAGRLTPPAFFETGIYIRAKIGERWESVDIGDPRLPDAEVEQWLRSLPTEGLIRCGLLLLGRYEAAAGLK